MATPPEYPSQAIIKAGEITQSFKPKRLASLAFVEDNTLETQREIATALDCSPPTVSNHLKMYAELPIPIINRSGPSITPAGHQLIGYLNDYMAELGTDFDTIDWKNPDDLATINECLVPLHNSRGPLLSLVIYSIGVRNSAGKTLDLLHAPEPVRISPVVNDVKNIQQKRGETASREQIRWRLTNLENAGCITVSDKTISITDKGEAQVRLFEHILGLLEHDSEDGDPYIESQPNHAASSNSISIDDGIPINFEVKSNASFVPEYQLADNVSIALKETMTVDEFVEIAAQLRRQYHGNEQMQLRWLIQEQESELEDHKLLE